MPRVGKRHKLYPDNPLFAGVYRDGDDPKADIVVTRSAGTGRLKAVTKEQRFRYDAAPMLLKEASAKHYVKALELSAQKGKAPERGKASGIFVQFLKTRQNGPEPLCAVEATNRAWKLAWWADQIGARSLDQLEQAELINMLSTFRLKGGRLPSPSYKDKMVSALSNVYRGLYGPTGINPLRGLKKFEKNPYKGQRRHQSYFLIDAIFAHMRDRGQGSEDSRTKAILMAEAYAGIERGELIHVDPKRDIKKAKPADFPIVAYCYIPERPKTNVEGGDIPLMAKGLAALERCEAAGVFGMDHYPQQAGIWRTFCAARNAALATLATLPDLPDDVDLERARGMRPKDLRHSWGTEAMKWIKDADIARRLLRHAKGSMSFWRYVEAAMDEIGKEGFKKLATAHATRREYVHVAAAPTKKAPLAFRKRRAS